MNYGKEHKVANNCSYPSERTIMNIDIRNHHFIIKTKEKDIMKILVIFLLYFVIS